MIGIKSRFVSTVVNVGALSLSLGAVVGAQVTPVVLEGQLIPGVGNVVTCSALAINDDGEWLVRVRTDNPDPDADEVMLSQDGVLLREGQLVSDPAGFAVDLFDSVNLDNSGRIAWNLDLDEPGNTAPFEAVYLDDSLVLQKNQPPLAPQFVPNTKWRGFDICLLNQSGQMLTAGLLQEPPTGDVFQAYVLYDLDASGQVVSAELLVRDGDLLPGQSSPVNWLGNRIDRLAFNDAGQVLYFVTPAGGAMSVYLDELQLATEAGPAPIPGRAWDRLDLAGISMNGAGDWLIRGRLDGDIFTRDVIVKNGAKFVQAGDALASIAPFTLTAFFYSRVSLGENGSVLWWALWNDADFSKNAGMFLDQDLIVQKGVTLVGGATMTSLPGGQVLSPYGEWVLFSGTLDTGNQGVFLWGGGPWKGLGHGLVGTGGLMPSYSAAGELSAGTPLVLDVRNALPFSTAALVVSLTELAAPFKGGTLMPSPDVLLSGFPVDANGDLSLPTVFPPGVPPGFEIISQFWITDPGAPQGFSASNALSGTTG